jgi:hypothetical protein
MSATKKAILRWAFGILSRGLLCGAVAIPSLFAQAEPHQEGAPAKLIQEVREKTQQFIDVNNAGPAGYEPAFGCVSGPDHGAMGIHYVNGSLVGDGEIDVAYPEALIYEPIGNKRRLVGVEFIVDAATWLKNHNNIPPALEARISNSLARRTALTGPLLRAPRLGLARQSTGCLRRLEQQRNLRASVSRARIPTTIPNCPLGLPFERAVLILIANAMSDRGFGSL